LSLFVICEKKKQVTTSAPTFQQRYIIPLISRFKH